MIAHVLKRCADRISARTRLDIRGWIYSGEAEHKKMRKRKVRQLLRDWKNAVPGGQADLTAMVGHSRKSSYSPSLPIPDHRLEDSPQNDSMRALERGLRVLYVTDFPAWLALRAIYLDVEAGDRDRDHYAARHGEFSDLLTRERRGVDFLTDYLRPYKLTVRFADQLPPPRNSSVVDQYQDIANYRQQLIDGGERRTRATEQTASRFNIGVTTVKRALRWAETGD